MFVIAPEVVEEKPPEAEELLPELAIVDYPRSTYRLHWLYTYYLSWGEVPLPFLDRRSPLAITKRKRRAFVHFTNMYYARWVRQYARAAPSWITYAGRLNSLCPSCRQRTSCKELCVLAIAQQKAGLDPTLQARIGSFCSEMGVSSSCTPLVRHRLEAQLPNLDLCFSEEAIGRRPRLKIDHSPPPLVPLPEGQEDEDEWE